MSVPLVFLLTAVPYYPAPSVLYQWLWSPCPMASQALRTPSGMPPLSQPPLSINIAHPRPEGESVKIVLVLAMIGK